jgi:hypothetical protein
MKYGVRIIKSSIFSFLKINVFVTLSTFIFGISAINLFISNYHQVKIHDEEISIWLYLNKIIMVRPIGIILTFLVVILSPIIAFTQGNKYIINKISLIILNDTKANFIYPLLDKAFLNIKNNNPKLLDEGKKTVKLQFKLIEEIENSNNNKWLKQLIVQTLNKINLDVIKNVNENIDLKTLVANKILYSLKSTPKPSRKFIYFIILSQILIYIILKIEII